MLGAWGAKAQDNVLFPTSGQKTVDLSNKQVGYSMNVYDNGGANGNYTDYCDGQILIKAPQKGSLTLEGSIVTEACCDYLLVYNGSDQSAPVIAEYRGTCNFILQSDNDMLLYFHTDRSVIASGIDSKLFINVNVVESEFTYYDKEKTILKEYTGDKQNVVVPSNVKEIGTNAFNNSCRIVLIPNTVEKIVTKAFNHTAGMKIYCEAESKPDGWAGNWNPNDYPVYWNSAKIPDYDYTINSNNKITITSCNLDKTIVRIPATIRIKGEEYEVTNIATSAFKYCDNLKKVVVGENITGIGENAFQNCPTLETVDLADAKKLTYINDKAFANSSIKRIDIPDWITSIGTCAFQNCDGLTNIAIPASVTWIGNYAFQYCDNLATVDLSQAKGLKRINDYAFYECYGLKNIEIPNWITSIGNYAFYNCDNLTNVNIPNSVTSIGSQAFYDCDNLATIDLSQAKGLKSINAYEFYGCTGLKNIEIPNWITSIGNYAFYNCDKLTSVSIPNSVTLIGNHAFYDCDGLKEITIPNSVATIGDYAFYGCNNLVKADLSNAKKLTSIGYYLFYNCYNLTSVSIPNSVNRIGICAFYNCDGLTEITIPNSVTLINTYAFYDCDGLKEITIPEKVTSIGEYAFYSCDNLAKADLSNAKSLTSIGSYAFSNNTNLKTADLSNAESLTTINDYAFSSCANLEKVDLSGAKNLSYVNNNAFLRCPKLKSFGSSGGKAIYSADGKTLLCYLAVSPDTAFTVPSTVTTIANNAFINCNKLKQVTIPSSVTSIGSYAFNGCNNLAKIDLSKATGLTSFGSYAFSGCPKLATIDLSATSLTTIGSSAFYGNDYLTEITLPESVTSIGENAFYDCDNLKKVTIPSSVTSIGNYAFYGCGKLAKVDFNKARDLTYIGVNTFNACALTTIDLSATSLTTIGSSAFYDNNYLTEITLPESVILIDSYAFSYCDNLKDVSIPESLTHLASNAFEGSSNVKFTELNGALYLGNSRNPYVVLYKASSTDITECSINNKTKVIAQNAFSGCSNLKSINIPASVVAINNCAFIGCVGLEKVSLPDNVDIYSQVFYNCYSLASVDVPASVSYIGESAFYCVRNINYTGKFGSATQTWGALMRNGKMSWGYTDGDFVFDDEAKTSLVAYIGSGGSIEIPESTVSINSDVFVGCKGITKVVIPDSVKYIYSDAFKGCTGLKTLKIGSGVTYIESNAFNGCPIETLTYNTEAIGAMFADNNTLKTVNVGNKVTNIGYQAFQGCTNLTTVNFSNAKNLTTIEGQAFYNSGLTELTIPQTVTSIGANAFAYCQNLKKVDLSNATGISVLNNLFFNCPSLESIVVPDWITDIDIIEFENCTSLKSVTLGSGITSIGNNAFSGCPIETLTFNTNYIGRKFENKTSLKKVTAGSKVTSIPDYAFSGCTNLSEINIGGNVASVGYNAFNGCSNITSVVTSSNADFSNSGIFINNDGFRYRMYYKDKVTLASNSNSGRVVIPETVKAGNTFTVIGIGSEAFYECDDLTEVVIPKTVTTIGSNAFYECYGLTEITIPESVTTIGSKAFYGCDGLLKVDLSNAKSLTRIENEAFYSCDNLAELDLENAESLNFIGDWAIAYCPSLESIIIPKSVKNMGSYVFRSSSNISPILCEAASQPSSWNYYWNPNNYQVIWHYNNIKVNVSANDASLGTVEGTGTYSYGDEIHIKAKPAKGAFFTGWSDGASFDDFHVYAQEDIDITAQFHAVTEAKVGQNSVYGYYGAINNCVFKPEKDGTYIISSASDYNTQGCLYDADMNYLAGSYYGGYGNNFKFTYDLQAGKTYYIGVGFYYSGSEGDIIFNIEMPYIVSATAKNGTVAGTGTYSKGTYVGLHAVPEDGYHFVKWSDGETSDWRYLYVYNDVNYTAEFAINEYEITGSVSSGYGTIGGTGTYAHGSEVSLIAKPNKGYEFIRWGDGNTDNPRRFKAEESKEYYAVVVSKTFNVEASGNHVSSVDIWGDCYYGNTIELKAWPEYNYHFKEWRDSRGNVISTANPFYYTVTEDAKITAVVEGDEFTIGTSMDNGTVQGGGTYNYGSKVTLTAVANPGFKFAGWADAVQTATRTITVNYNADYTAYTLPIKYSVELSAENGVVSGGATNLNYGDEVTISATPNSGFKFVRWSDGNTSATRTLTITRDYTLKAVCMDAAETLYTISATAGQNGSVMGGGRYKAGEKVTLTAIANPGYHFVKWSDGSTNANNVVTVSGDKSLSAEFAVNTYTVSVTAGANGTVSGGGSFEFGAPATITATPATGYHFAGWSDGSAVANRTFNVSADLDLKAEFAINTYSVKATAKNGKVEGAGTYNHGTEAILTATAATGYHFSQWSDGNTNNPRKATVTADMDFAAEFEVNTYEITAAAQNGTVSGAGTYNYGAMATLTATANAGYHFTQWSDGVLSSSRSVFVSEDMKFTAEFAIDAYNVSAYAQNGSVEGAGYYNHGASATLTAKANEGYHFTQWSDGVKDKSRTETVLSSMSFEAEFEVNSFNITAAESANGVVSGAGTYSYGAMATLTAVANEGYHFTQWSDGLTSATRRLTVVEDAEFGATFEINSYEVKLSAENGTVSGAGTFEHGAEATISAKAAEHYHFARWSDGNTDNPRKLTVTKNRSLKAVFEADLFTIKVEAENGTIYGASSGFEFGAVATLTASPDLGYHFEKWSDGNTDNPRSVTIDATVLSNLDKPFTAIFEKNPSYVGIEESAAVEVSIYAYGSTIVVENAAADIFVYDAMGRMIVRETATADRTEIQVEGTGVYVVKTGSVSKRVMIK